MATKRQNKAAESEHEDREVSFNTLHFDPTNPRGEPQSDENVIRQLFGVQEETAVLATHIAAHGLNPLDRIALVDHPDFEGHYLIREGNRRLCALQLLRDPERAPTPDMRRRYRRLAESGRPVPDRLMAVYFPKRPTTGVWMSVKHEGPQGGLGTVGWSSGMKARFNREGETGPTRPKNPNRQAESLLTYAVSRGLITPEQRELIAITTITRYLPNVRAALALVNGEDTTTNAPQASFDAGIKAFLLDALEPGDDKRRPVLHSRSESPERKAYAETLRERGLSPGDRSLMPYQPSSAAPTRPAVKRNSNGRSATHPGKRTQLVLPGFVVTHKDPVLLRMVAEGKALHPDEARFSCNYLNRAILERVVYLYAKRHGIGYEGKFQPTLERVRAHAEASEAPPTKGISQVLTKAGDTKSSFAYEVLGQGVHGGAIPAGADNRSNWESLQPALEYLLSRLR